MIKNYFNDDKLFESVYKMNECGSSCDTRSTYGCGSLGYSHSCEVGRTVKISVGEGCGSHIVVGRLLGYAS